MSRRCPGTRAAATRHGDCDRLHRLTSRTSCGTGCTAPLVVAVSSIHLNSVPCALWQLRQSTRRFLFLGSTAFVADRVGRVLLVVVARARRARDQGRLVHQVARRSTRGANDRPCTRPPPPARASPVVAAIRFSVSAWQRAAELAPCRLQELVVLRRMRVVAVHAAPLVRHRPVQARLRHRGVHHLAVAPLAELEARRASWRRAWRSPAPRGSVARAAADRRVHAVQQQRRLVRAVRVVAGRAGRLRRPGSSCAAPRTPGVSGLWQFTHSAGHGGLQQAGGLARSRAGRGRSGTPAPPGCA